jgi:hypothetical protein
VSVERIHLIMDDRVSSVCGNGSERVVSKNTFLRMTDNPELCKRCLAKLTKGEKKSN